MARRGFLGVVLLGVAAVAVGSMSSAAHGGSVFNSVPGCVLFDTRVAGGAMEAREIRTFHVVGSASDFVAQGGTAGGCGIPGFVGGQPVASAAVINLTAISPTRAGSLRVWPSDEARPPVDLVTFQKTTPQLNISNASVIALRQDVEGADITIRANSAGVHVRGTVTGFFTELAGTEPEEDPTAIRKGNNGLGLVAGQVTSGRHRLSGAEAGPVAVISAGGIANVNAEKNSNNQCSLTVLNSPFSGRTYTFVRQVAATTTSGTLAQGATNATVFLTEASVRWQLWEAGTGSLTARVITIDASMRAIGTTCDFAASMYTGGS